MPSVTVIKHKPLFFFLNGNGKDQYWRFASILFWFVILSSCHV